MIDLLEQRRVRSSGFRRPALAAAAFVLLLGGAAWWSTEAGSDSTGMAATDGWRHPFDTIGLSEVGRGAFDDGTAWVLSVNEHHEPELSVDLAESGGGGAWVEDPVGAPTEPMYPVTDVKYGGRHFAAGLVTDDVATVELRTRAGELIDRLEPVAGSGYRGWVAEIDNVLVVVALDDAGQEIGQEQRFIR